MQQIEGMVELQDSQLEQAAGACRLAAVIFLDTDGDGTYDEAWLIYDCG